MENYEGVELIPIRGTSESEIRRHRRPYTGLVSRTQTIETFLKKEALDHIAVNFNKPLSKLNEDQKTRDTWYKQRPIKRKLSRFLKENIRPNLKTFMRSHDLWGDTHYNNVLKGSNLTDNFFMENHEEIKQKKKIGLTSVQKAKKVFEEEVLQPAAEMTQLTYKKYRNEGRKDLKSILDSVEKSNEQIDRIKLQKTCYKEMSNLLINKLAEFRGNDDIQHQQLEMMQKCSSYNHLVEKNLPKSYKIGHSSTNSTLGTYMSALSTPRQKSSSKGIRQPTSSKQRALSKTMKKVRVSFQNLSQCIQNFEETTNNHELKKQMQAFEKYYEKCENVRSTKEKNLRKLR